ncbi:hypothetical protein BN3087_910008 [Sulfurovum sp. enrichment culture clone C5]|uniref:Uncharacterized protein n=1 Tax=Sulfurovum sp. enrichment culture clone C5 TaxID=497650 RepID=A0A0S4XQJ4_9BACT|nr:hypothetical protein BN3087_910008 [Sulfurovum sp. enrichment culture clone C5]
MQLVTLKVEDGFLNQFMQYINTLPKNKVEVLKNTLSLEIKKRIEDIESGKETYLTFHDGLDDIRDNIVKKYANS